MTGQPPVVWDRADGFQVYDRYGNQWLDWSSGVVVANAGHSAPEIKEAVLKQVEKGLLHTYCFPSAERAELVQLLVNITPAKLNKVFLLTTGAETTECSVKLARTYGQRVGGKQKIGIISFEGAFHARTLGAQQIGGIPTLKEWIVNLDPDMHQVPFPDGFRTENTVGREERAEKVDPWGHDLAGCYPVAQEIAASPSLESGGKRMRWKRVVTVVGVHAEGEYGKVVTGGIVDVPGKTMFDKMRYLRDHDDGLRKFLLFEPRGSAVHSANVVLPSSHPKAQLGYVIMESTEYPPMSGSNTICTVTAILETGILPMKEPVTELDLETPGGLIHVTCQCRDGKVLQVKFRNVPAFVQYLDAPLEVKGVGTLRLDVAYGGMHFALVDAATLGFLITPDEARDICVMGERIREAAREQLKVVHPENPGIRGITITEFTGPLQRQNRGLTAKNTVVVSPGRIDRSPCGTGTSARLAVMHARRQIRRGQRFDHTSIIGTHFLAEVVGTARVGTKPAVVTTVAGRGYVTDIGQYGLDPDDPLPEGYTLSDTWLTTVASLQL